MSDSPQLIADLLDERRLPPADFNHVTLGDFAEEDGPGGSKEAFEKAAKATGMFHIYAEVPASYLYRKPFTKGSVDGRIDFILVPRIELVRHGWAGGAIGVECKKSNEKIGKAICQCLDYRQAVYRIEGAGHLMMLDQVFIWPFHRAYGDVASIMAHFRIGGVMQSGWALLNFCLSDTNMLTIDSGFRVTIKDVRSGRKAGSR